MHHDILTLGTTFSEWSALTEQYASGMEALRRREPGASARMMEISKLMAQYQRALGQDASAPESEQVLSVQAPVSTVAPRWFQAAAKMVFAVRILRLSH